MGWEGVAKVYRSSVLLSLGENPREKQKYRREGFSDYQIEALFRHNFYRSFHENTPQLKLWYLDFL